MKSEVPVPTRPSHDAIALRAAELWRQRGCPAGHDLDIWLEAEHQLGALIHSPQRRRAPFHDASSLRDRVQHEVVENDAADTRSPTSMTLTP